jgi:hypothetical protein
VFFTLLAQMRCIFLVDTGEGTMRNDFLKSAIKVGMEPLIGDFEVLGDDLDDVSGGACGTFRCGIYQVT